MGRPSTTMLAALAALCGLVIAAAWRSGAALDPDAVSYLRLAGYYVHGPVELAVSGYWGPLFTWILAPLSALVTDPVLAARIAVALTTPVFFFGSLAVLDAFGLRGASRTVGIWMLVLFCAASTAKEITPDLLMTGLFAFAVSRVTAQAWISSPRHALVTGAIFGASYLAKYVALPLFVIVACGCALMWGVAGRAAPRSVAKALAVTLLGFALVAGPWIGILSVKYGYPTFSTAGAVNHAITGPRDVDRWHPTFRVLHSPQDGRLTSWEDPSVMSYHTWSPVESEAYALHQFETIYNNAGYVRRLLAELDFLGLGFLCAILAFVCHAPWREGMRGQLWRWSLIPIAGAGLLYMPFLPSAQRYFYVAYPFVLAAALGFLTIGLEAVTHRARWPRFATFALVVVAFAGATVPSLARTLLLRGPDAEVVASRRIARHLQEVGAAGPVASVGTNGHVALYAALWMERPFCGNAIAGDIRAQLKDLPVRVVLVGHGSPLRAAVVESPGFTLLAPVPGESWGVEVFVRKSGN